MTKISIDDALCTACGRCVATCPAAIFMQREKGAVPDLDHAEFCIKCGHCVAICPVDAVTHAVYPEGSVKPTHEALMPSAEALEELLLTRRSIRAFKEQAVERELIERVLGAAQHAPTAHNAQNTAYVVVQDKAVRDEIVRLTAAYFAKMAKQLHNPVTRRILRLIAGPVVENAAALLPELDLLIEAIRNGRDMVLHDAPCLVFIHAPRHEGFADVNANLALQNATLMAQTLGLGSFYLGFVVATCARDKSIPTLLGIPEGHAVYAGMALGHPRFHYEKWLERKPPRVNWQ